jgi:hypothetical protein
LPRNTAPTALSAGVDLDRLQHLARLGVQRQPPVLVALADDVDPARAGVNLDVLPGERD